MSAAPSKMLATLNVNGRDVTLAFLPHATLLEVLREELRLTGTKHGCELGQCGACTVLVDGAPVLSCLTLAAETIDRPITSVEGIAVADALHPVQRAFLDLGAAQCGYCTPGFIVAAVHLLERTTSPSEAEIREALAGHLCRCTGYTKIVEAVALAGQRMRATAHG